MKQSKKFLFQLAKPSRKRAKLEVVELATIQHQEADEKNPGIEDIPADLLVHEADIFRKLGIPWVPEAEQDPTAGRSFDSDKENLQKTI